MEEIILTQEMITAYDAVKSRQHTVIFGAAGTGKTTFIDYLVGSGLKLMKVAPTGIAANAIGGSTLHSAFRLAPRIMQPSDIRPLDYYGMQLLSNIDAIMIDEVSMVRSDVLDNIDLVLKKSMRNEIPFGGVPIIFMGDMGQLPPVVTNSERDYFNFKYKSEFFFDSIAFKQIEDEANFVNFTEIFRQKDQNFKNILNKIRFGEITQKEIEELNNSTYLSEEKDHVTLCTRNDDVRRVNEFKLEINENVAELYTGEITGDFKEKNCIANVRLVLKEKSRVMILINNGDNYHNGSLGLYLGMERDEEGEKVMRVRLDSDNEEVLIKRHKFEEVRQSYDRDSDKVKTETKGSMKQYPIALGYAFTSHKSQGMTFDRMSFDIGRGAFASGQTYVSLSRVRSIEGLRLVTKLKPKDIIFDIRIKTWLKSHNLIFSFE